MRFLKFTTALSTTLFIGFAANALTLPEAVQQTLNTNPDMVIVLSEKEIAKADEREAFAGYLPSLDITARTGPQWTNSPSTRSAAAASSGRRERQPTLNETEATATLRQLLFDGFGTTAEVGRRAALVEAAGNRVEERGIGLAIDTSESYLEVLRRNRLLSIAQDNLTTHQQYRDMVRKRSEGGGGTVADLRQAESRLSTAETTLAQLKGTLADAEASYQRLVGVAPDNLARPEFDFGILPADVDGAVAQAMQSNPAVLSARGEAKAADEAAGGAYSSYFPRFDLELSGTSGNDLDGIEDANNNASAMVVARWNLFRGGGDDARKDSLLLRRSRAKDVVARVERNQSEQVRFAWNAMSSARERVQTLRNVVSSNERVRDAYLKQFELGQRSLLDLLDSENELFLSRSDLVTAEYTALFGGYRLMASMGTLPQHFGVKMPELKQASAQ
jgi:adhesin transport system outer membrane protein